MSVLFKHVQSSDFSDDKIRGILRDGSRMVCNSFAQTRGLGITSSFYTTLTSLPLTPFLTIHQKLDDWGPPPRDFIAEKPSLFTTQGQTRFAIVSDAHAEDYNLPANSAGVLSGASLLGDKGTTVRIC